MNNEQNDSFGGGGFRPNWGNGYDSGRKRGFYHSDHTDGGIHAKLYVAPIPRTSTEAEIHSLFKEHGNIVEVVLFKDKRTGQQQGSCFVKFAKLEEADRAIRALNNQHTFPGEVAPIKVRYAERDRERLGNCAFADKLYVGCVNKQASKKEIEEIFSAYGFVEDIYVARDDLKQNRGCAFVKYSHKDMAIAAINALHGTFTMRGCDLPLIVRFADPKKPKTGEQRGNYAFSNPNFGPPSQEPVIRPVHNYGDSMGGHILPNTSFPVPPTTTNSCLQSVSQMAIQVPAASNVMQQPFPPLQKSPSQLSQMSAPQPQTLQKNSQSSQQAVSEMQKQLHPIQPPTQYSEHHQILHIARQQQSLHTGSNPQTVSTASTTPSVPPSPQTSTLVECDWSEHTCPDGYKYYYNCVTCESRWEKPEEFTLFDQQSQKQQHLQNPGQQLQPPSSVLSTQEVTKTEMVQLLQPDHYHQKLQFQQPSLSAPGF